jgi:hypothetical protein
MSILTTMAVSAQEGDTAKQLLGYYMSTPGFALAMDHAPTATPATPNPAGAVDPLAR